MHQAKGVEVLSVAIDAQGPERARPYVEKAGATFPTVVDAENVLGQLFDCKAIPNAVFVDPDGVVRYIKRGGFDIRKPEYAQAAEAWAAGAPVDAASDAGGVASEALAHYREGLGSLPGRAGRGRGHGGVAARRGRATGQLRHT